MACTPCQAAAARRAAYVNGLGATRVPREILRAHALEHRAMRRAGIKGAATPESFLKQPYFWALFGVSLTAVLAMVYYGTKEG